VATRTPLSGPAYALVFPVLRAVLHCPHHTPLHDDALEVRCMCIRGALRWCLSVPVFSLGSTIHPSTHPPVHPSIHPPTPVHPPIGVVTPCPSRPGCTARWVDRATLSPAGHHPRLPV